MANIPINQNPLVDRVLEDAERELLRQISVFPEGFPADRNGVRLAIVCGEDELREAWMEWQLWKKMPASHNKWGTTRHEMMQAACVILYGIMCIDNLEHK